MKFNKTWTQIGLAAVIALISALPSISALAANGSAGSEGSGGGIYGKVKGKWFLLDDLEEGKIIDLKNEPSFFKVAEQLMALDKILPELAQQLREPLKNKTWHMVSFELRCEEAASPLDVEQTPGACQDDNDVWVSEPIFSAVDPAKLIMHELVQGIRLHERDRTITRADVRAVTRILDRVPLLDENSLRDQLMKYHFKRYKTYSEIQAYEARMAPVREAEARYEKASTIAYDLANRHCSNPIDARNDMEFANTVVAIAEALREGWQLSDIRFESGAYNYKSAWFKVEMMNLNNRQSALNGLLEKCNEAAEKFKK